MAFVAHALPQRHPPRRRICTTRLSAVPDQSPDQPPATSTDWRAFRARLIRQHGESAVAPEQTASSTSFAHLLAVPEQGAVLLANPRLFLDSQTYFRRAVILLFAHQPNGGTAGLLLNRPSSELRPPLPVPPPPFRSGDVRLGGDVSDESMFALYPTPREPISKHPVVLPGLSLLADVKDVVKAVGQGDINESDVRLYRGYCGWAPGQLATEVMRGVWYLAAVSSDILLDADTTSLYDRLTGELGLKE